MTPQGPPPDPPSGCTGFDFLERIDQGGYGTVWRARGTPDCPLTFLRGEVVAIKVLENGPDDTTELNRIPEHPALVRIHQVTDDRPRCVIMEYVHGRTLKRWLGEVAGQSPAERLRPALRLLRGVLGGLEALHDAGIVHGDVKPENILVPWDPAGEDDVVRIVDIRVLNERTAGTPYYLAPEQLDEPPDESKASDLFSAGLVLAEAILGEPAVPRVGGPMDPIDRARIALGRFDPEGVARRVGDVCPQLEPLLRRVLAMDKTRRLADAGVFRRKIDRTLRWLEGQSRSRGHRFLVVAEDRAFGGRLRDSLQERGHRAEVVDGVLEALDDWLLAEVVVVVKSPAVDVEEVETLLVTPPPRPLVVVGSGLNEPTRLAVLDGGGGLVEGRPTEEIVVRTAIEVLDRLRTGILEKRLVVLERRLGSDPETGLPTRLVFERRLRVLIDRCAMRPSIETLHVLVLDVDGFRDTEADRGRKAADDLLRRIAERFRECGRAGDVFARDDLHPDRFLLLAPRTSREQARTIGVRYRQAIVDLGVTWSIGLAGYPEGGETAAEVILRAEERLRRSKGQGPDSLCFGDGPEDLR
jgi:diguanylate cyclase (GGDEF)-like protein